MAPSPAQHKVTGITRGRLLIALLTMSASVQSKYASGERRSGKKLINQTSLEERQLPNRLHCLALCERRPDCHAFNFGAVSPVANCQLLAEGACSGHPLVADSAVDYYDVYAAPTAERQLPHWKEPSCVQDGYCAVDCAAPDDGTKSCFTDDQCQRPELPAGTFRCLSGVCQREERFWEVRPGLQLPRWMSWTADMFKQTFKKLKSVQCELDMKLKMGDGAKWVLLIVAKVAGHSDSTITFEIDLDGEVTTITSVDLWPNYAVRQVSAPTALANTQNFTHLKLSWCNGMAMGPADNPRLLDIRVTKPSLTYHFVAAQSQNNDSWMYVDSGVADPWLFEKSGTDSDPVFQLSGPWAPSGGAFIGRDIDPSEDVTIKYDCMTKGKCQAFFYLSTSEHLRVAIGGGNDNRAYRLYLHSLSADNDNKRSRHCCRSISATPILNENEYVTFTIRYNRGHITVFRNDATQPAVNTSTPGDWWPLGTTITRVGLGDSNSTVSRSVRLARYDDAWATDTWLAKGAGFSNMAFKRP